MAPTSTDAPVAESASGKESNSVHDEKLAVEAQARSTARAERALVRKLDLHLVPVLTMLYLLSFLDRSNIGNAKLDGLTTQLHMDQGQYLNALTMVMHLILCYKCVHSYKLWCDAVLPGIRTV